MMRVPDPNDDVLKGLSDSDLAFLYRVFEEDPDTYVKRVRQVGFGSRSKVLDAGSGFGQWTFALGKVCETVHGLDISLERVRVGRSIATMNGANNVVFTVGDLESLPYSSNSFDGVFSYSAVYFSDFNSVADEFYRVLQPGGVLYVCTNGLGKYLHDILHNPNPATDFSARKFGLKTIRNTLLDRTNNLSKEVGGQVMSPKGTRTQLESAGFESVRIEGEGKLTVDDGFCGVENNFYDAKFLGFSKVFEAVARKPQ